MTQEEAINRLKIMAFKSHPLNTTNDCVDLDAVIELVEELFEQNPHKHGVSGKRPTDEEIERWVKEHGYYGHCTQEYHEGLEEGARWGINKMSEAAGVPTRSDGKAGD